LKNLFAALVIKLYTSTMKVLQGYSHTI